MRKTMERPLNLKHFFLMFLLLFTFTTFAQDEEEGGYGDYVPEVVVNADDAKGKELFNSLCAACHKRYKNATGPALHKVTDLSNLFVTIHTDIQRRYT